MATMEAERRTENPNAVAPFGIEADGPRMEDLALQCIHGLKLRSAVAATKPATDFRTGHPKISQDQAAYLGNFPPIPGMQLHVSPAKLTYTAIDPLHEDKDLCERIQEAMKEAGTLTSSKLRGVPSQTGTLDKHRMKSLIREMLNLVKANEARVCKGTLPTEEQLAQLPGRFLKDPGARIPNSQPIFEDEWDNWIEKRRYSGA